MVIGAIFAGSELSITILRLHTDLESPAGVALSGGGVLIVIMAAWVLSGSLEITPGRIPLRRDGLPEDRSEAITPVMWESPPLDRLIHEPARYHIMAILYVIESADFLFLRNQTGMTDGNLSSHLSKLEKAGYVHVTKEFVGRKPRTMLSLTDSGRRAFDQFTASGRLGYAGRAARAVRVSAAAAILLVPPRSHRRCTHRPQLQIIVVKLLQK